MEGKESSKSISLVGAAVTEKGAVLNIRPASKGEKDVDLKVCRLNSFYE